MGPHRYPLDHVSIITIARQPIELGMILRIGFLPYVALAGSLSSCGVQRSISETCHITALTVSLQGTLLRNGSSTSILFDTPFDTTLIGEENFEFLAAVLGRGAPTGSASAIWGVVGRSPVGALIFQMTGVRETGTTVPVLGAYFPGLPPGIGPSLGSSPAPGIRVLFVLDDYRAASASGELVVQSAGPLRGALTLHLLGENGEAIEIQGQLTTIASTTSCSP